MKKKNIFESLIQIYRKGIKRADKKGYAEKLKTCSELFFAGMTEGRETPITFKDIEYRDGYFVFGTGTNSIVHFRVEECPGWLFGIWWTIPDKKVKEPASYQGTVFTQYEENIDKFKPSGSELVANITAHPDAAEPYCSTWEARKMIDFIIKEPYLAFCRDYYSWNYNYEYHTREEAKEQYDKWREWKNIKDAKTREWDEKILDFVRENILPLYKDSRIEDCGESWSPRYQVVAPLSSNQDVATQPGDYNWFEDGEEGEEEIMQKYYELVEEGKKESDKGHYLWYSPVHPLIFLYDKENQAIK